MRASRRPPAKPGFSDARDALFGLNRGQKAHEWFVCLITADSLARSLLKESPATSEHNEAAMTDHAFFMAKAYDQALASYQSGGVPVGSVLVRGGEIVGEGHNQRVQKSDPIAHGEMDCLRQAGRQRSYRDTVIYTTLSPCMMCTGTIILFKIPTVVIGECVNFGGNEQLLRDRGVNVIDLKDPRCIDLMARFIRERPDIWNEDIAE
jgi:cytosine/creatinine deaminase